MSKKRVAIAASGSNRKHARKVIRKWRSAFTRQIIRWLCSVAKRKSQRFRRQHTVPAPDDSLFEQQAESPAGIFTYVPCCAESYDSPSRDLSVVNCHFEPAAIERKQVVAGAHAESVQGATFYEVVHGLNQVQMIRSIGREPRQLVVRRHQALKYGQTVQSMPLHQGSTNDDQLRWCGRHRSAYRPDRMLIRLFCDEKARVAMHSIEQFSVGKTCRVLSRAEVAVERPGS